jgi:peptidyl-prolyl cis-trans isomerase B (cyclophilin B)
MRVQRLLVLSASVAVVAAACSAASAPSSTAQNAANPTPATTVALEAVPSNYSGYLQQPAACGADQPSPAVDMKFDEPADVSVVDPTTVILHTSCGDIEIVMDGAGAPESVNSFVFLAQSGYFDGTVSHRIVPGFMMQAGDPTATGLGGPGYSVPDEYPDEPDYRRGVVAMANAGPGTTGSQFFILFGDARWLPASFTIIGEVKDGFETLDLIEQIPLGTGPNSADSNASTPLESLFIESVSVSG